MEITQKFGSLMFYLLFLEFGLRKALRYFKENKLPNHNTERVYSQWKVGEDVPEDSITNFLSLRQLIEEYNSELSRRGMSEFLIDRSIVDTRDAIAHGRVLSDDSGVTPFLIKFSKAKSKRVTVEYRELLDDRWFEQQTRRAVDAHNATVKAMQMLYEKTGKFA
jgi:hypothetical protein